MSTKKNRITPENAAYYLGVSVKTLAKWRSVGTPMLPFSKIGRCVRYSFEDLDEYLAKHTYNKVEG